MASKEEVIALMARMKSIHPHYIIEKTKIDDRGMAYLIKYLFYHGGSSYTHELSKVMNVSTARVSILINKLEVKGYVERKTAEDDARKTIISLTEKGRVYHQALEDKMTKMFAGMIDYIGKDDLDGFINILEKMTTFLHDYPLDLDNEEGK